MKDHNSDDCRHQSDECLLATAGGRCWTTTGRLAPPLQHRSTQHHNITLSLSLLTLIGRLAPRRHGAVDLGHGVSVELTFSHNGLFLRRHSVTVHG